MPLSFTVSRWFIPSMEIKRKQKARWHPPSRRFILFTFRTNVVFAAHTRTTGRLYVRVSRVTRFWSFLHTDADLWNQSGKRRAWRKWKIVDNFEVVLFFKDDFKVCEEMRIVFSLESIRNSNMRRNFSRFFPSSTIILKMKVSPRKFWKTCNFYSSFYRSINLRYFLFSMLVPIDIYIFYYRTAIIIIFYCNN